MIWSRLCVFFYLSINWLVFLFLFPFLVGTTWAARIDSVRFEGLTRTKADYLERIVKSKPGLECDSIRVIEDVCLLRNLNLFFNVESRIDRKSEGYVDVVFIILEAKYIYPIFSVSGFKGQLKVNAGVNHINFLGRAQTLGGMYQYYDRCSQNFFIELNDIDSSCRNGSDYFLK